jgi:2-C-methyl-D-erythritol 4-phosphate cytidylyltransferase
VHDAARPLVSPSIIRACLDALESFDGVAPAVKPVDSMVSVVENQIEPLSREQLRIVQTPQCFRVNVLKMAHSSDVVDTDEIGLVKQVVPGARLTFIEGAPELMKITSPSDLVLVDGFLRKR